MGTGIPVTIVALAESLSVSEDAARRIYEASLRYGIERGYAKGIARWYQMGREDERADVVAHARYVLNKALEPHKLSDGSVGIQAWGDASDEFDLFPQALLRGDHVGAAEEATDE